MLARACIIIDDQRSWVFEFCHFDDGLIGGKKPSVIRTGQPRLLYLPQPVFRNVPPISALPSQFSGLHELDKRSQGRMEGLGDLPPFLVVINRKLDLPVCGFENKGMAVKMTSTSTSTLIHYTKSSQLSIQLFREHIIFKS